MKTFKQFLDEKGRCWPGHKPVPGKKPYTPGSCKKEEVELEEAHKVGDMVTVNSKFFGKQKGKVTKVDDQSIHVQRVGKKTSEKYPHDAVMKEEVEQIDEDKMDKEIIKHASSGMKPHQIAKKLDIPTEWVHQTMKHQMPKPERDLTDPRTDKSGSTKMGEEVEVIWEAKKDDDDMPDHEVKVFDYDTNYFHICPTATKLYKDIEHKVEADDYDLIEGMAKLQDCIFFIEKHLKEKKGSPKEDDMGYLLVAQNIKDQLDRMLSMTTPEMRMEHGYLQGHIETIKELLDWENRKEELDEEYEWLEESAAWRRKEGKNPKGGLNRKGIMSYRRENPGSKLKMAVTGKVKPGSKAAKRRKSFCARMGGMPGPMKKPNGEPTRKALALRKWKCR